MAAQNRRYRKAHQKEVLAYRQKHREGRAAYNHRWREKNLEYDVARKLSWQKENPEKVAAMNARRNARKRNVVNTATPEQIEFERMISKATYPGEKLELHHPVSFSKGGNHSWGNIMFIPMSLNRSIGNKLPEEVYQQLELAGMSG